MFGVQGFLRRTESEAHLHFTRCAQRSCHIGKGRYDLGPTHGPPVHVKLSKATYCPATSRPCYKVATKTSTPPSPRISEGVEGGKQKIWSTPTVKPTSAALFATRAAMSKWLRMKNSSISSQMSQTAHLEDPQATRRVQHAHCTQTQLPAPQSHFDARSVCTPRDSYAEQKHSDCHLHFARCAQRSLVGEETTQGQHTDLQST